MEKHKFYKQSFVYRIDYPITVSWPTAIYGTKKKVPQASMDSMIKDCKEMLEKHRFDHFNPKNLIATSQVEDDFITTVTTTEEDARSLIKSIEKKLKETKKLCKKIEKKTK